MTGGRYAITSEPWPPDCAESAFVVVIGQEYADPRLRLNLDLREFSWTRHILTRQTEQRSTLWIVSESGTMSPNGVETNRMTHFLESLSADTKESMTYRDGIVTHGRRQVDMRIKPSEKMDLLGIAGRSVSGSLRIANQRRRENFFDSSSAST